MFRLECFVDDKNLAAVMHALSGIVRGAPTILPVANVEVKRNGKMEAATNGQLLSLFQKHLSETRDEKVTPDYVRTFLRSVGSPPTSYSYLLRRAIEAKTLRKVGKGQKTTYERNGK